jgi:protein-disulfide isomerase
VGEVEVFTFESLSSEGEKYGIILTPTIIINDKVVAAGRGTSEKELEKMVKKAFEANTQVK